MYKKILNKYYFVTAFFGFLTGILMHISRNLCIVKSNVNFYGFPIKIEEIIPAQMNELTLAQIMLWGFIFAFSFLLLNYLFKLLCRSDIRDYFQNTQKAVFIPLKKLEGIVDNLNSLNASFYLLNSDEVNAFTFQGPLGEPKVFLTSKLVNSLNKSELKAVIGHLLIHIGHQHTKRLASLFSYLFFMQRITISSPCFLRNIIAFLFKKDLIRPAKCRIRTVLIFLLLMLFGLIVFSFGLGLLGFALAFLLPGAIVACYCVLLNDVNSFSRECKIDADYHEVQKNHNASELAQAIEKIASFPVKLSEDFYDKNFEPLFFISPRNSETHQGIFERIKAVKKLSANSVF